MNNKKQEDLQSRREFFKSAAKVALPVIGAVVLSSIPLSSKASTLTGCYGCEGYCDGCEGNCVGSCEGSCRGCSSSCRGECKGSCRGCEGTCGALCKVCCN